ncbi:MAG: LLM class flavin-dependent oxidoreductase [Gammaproteobacteria bacterium]|nr:LLM class flavin-dependent oxidoreductase [Gammaproteobacteria bacterium]
MRLGAIVSPLGREAAKPAALADRARELVGEGFDSLWAVQAIGRGFMVSDPFITLAVAATATEDVELGTAIAQVPLYQPADFAHRVFSTMQVCGDRLLLGVGAGSTEKDFDAFERDYSTRFNAFSASMKLLRTFLAEGKTDSVDLSPWPSVKGGPPLLLGSWGAGVTRAAKHFDGWIASANYREVDEIIVAHETYRSAGGRRAIVSTFQIRPGDDLGASQDKLARFADAGFDDAVVLMAPGGPSPAEVRRLVS